MRKIVEGRRGKGKSRYKEWQYITNTYQVINPACSVSPEMQQDQIEGRIDKEQSKGNEIMKERVRKRGKVKEKPI